MVIPSSRPRRPVTITADGELTIGIMPRNRKPLCRQQVPPAKANGRHLFQLDDKLFFPDRRPAAASGTSADFSVSETDQRFCGVQNGERHPI
jgi:hypothetical protein